MEAALDSRGRSILSGRKRRGKLERYGSDLIGPGVTSFRRRQIVIGILDESDAWTAVSGRQKSSARPEVRLQHGRANVTLSENNRHPRPIRRDGVEILRQLMESR